MPPKYLSLLFVAHLAFATDIQTHVCETYFRPSDYCVIKRIQASESSPGFTIKTPKHSPVILSVHILDSEIPLWDNSVCDTFGHLKELEAAKSGIKKISPSVFRNCSQLTKLNLINNEIESVEPGTFSSLLNLESLWLMGNKIMIFSLKAVAGLRKLQDLDLSNNKLLDFDEKSFMSSLPDVTVRLGGNKLRCDRVLRMQEWSLKRYINRTSELKVKNFSGILVFDLGCLQKDKWKDELGQSVPNKEALERYENRLFEGSEYLAFYEDFFSDSEGAKTFMNLSEDERQKVVESLMNSLFRFEMKEVSERARHWPNYPDPVTPLVPCGARSYRL